MTVFEQKELEVSDTPLLLFDCTFRDGTEQHWSTHHVTVAGTEYIARVTRTNLFEMHAASEGGVDTIPKITFELANADGLVSGIQGSSGFKGATLRVRFVFYNLANSIATSEVLPLFMGLLDSPESVTESTFRVSAINRLSLQRIALPPVRIQKRCPWQFPTTAAQRAEAANGGTTGRMSRFYNCGYSADTPGGCGNLNAGAPFTDCDYSRAQCEQRGMFSQDAAGQTTARFGGIEYVPPVIAIRSAGEKGSHLSLVQDNEARYNDCVPLVYGTAWYTPGIVFARNDGNLTHLEVLLGVGEMTRVSTVLVNNIEIPIGQSGKDMTGCGWYNVLSYGTRNGVFNRDFADAAGNPLGDPYGSMAYLSIVVPNSINDGSSIPNIQVLADGLKIESFSSDGTSQGYAFCNNPVWVILDVLRRSGWDLTEIDLPAFATAATYCDAPAAMLDLNGNTVSSPRFQCNLAVRHRRSAGDVIRGIRNASRLYLTYSQSGLLQIKSENTLAIQQPEKMGSSNAAALLNGGWPVYEFGDGTNGTTGIARLADGSSSLRVSSRTAADTPNRFSIEFQDALNSYQQDSLTLADPEDILKCGFEVSATPNALGIPNYYQAAQVVALSLKKSVNGNQYVDFQTSVRAIGIQPGDIIAITYLREGFARTPFRVVKVSPGQNFRTAQIRAQFHDDTWYADDIGSSLFTSGQNSRYTMGLPRPVLGIVDDHNGDLQFGVTETGIQAQDGTATLMATVAYAAPAPQPTSAPSRPLTGLSPTIGATGGTLPANSVLYYALSSVDGDGNESPLSFTVAATTGGDPGTYSVTITSISLPGAAHAFNVYRGSSPSELTRIATGVPPAVTFLDTGYPNQPIAAPDANYDHANFYWRTEIQPATSVTLHSSTTIGNPALVMIADAMKGYSVRILTGVGRGQERTITANTSVSVTVMPPWSIEPDETSTFAIAQDSYQVGASGSAGQVQFAIPNRPGTVIQICGRSANALNVECPYESSTVTRWQIAGAGINAIDPGPPPTPYFALGVLDEGGGVGLTGVGFTTSENTQTISVGSLTLYYYDESSTDAVPTLTTAISAVDSTLIVAPKPTANLPLYYSIGTEIVRLSAVTSDGTGFLIDRGLNTTTAASHDAQTTALPLRVLTLTVPFPVGFFNDGSANNWTHSITLANARICGAGFMVSNTRGNSAVSSKAFTTSPGGGLRTLSGGQVVLQVPGFLAVQTNAVPVLDPGATYSVRDVYAYVNTAPSGSSGISLQVTVDAAPYCTLTISPGTTQSAPVDGAGLSVLRAGKKLGLNIASVGDQTPGADLTVVIRV